MVQKVLITEVQMWQKQQLVYCQQKMFNIDIGLARLAKSKTISLCLFKHRLPQT